MWPIVNLVQAHVPVKQISTEIHSLDAKRESCVVPMATAQAQLDVCMADVSTLVGSRVYVASTKNAELLTTKPPAIVVKVTQ